MLSNTGLFPSALANTGNKIESYKKEEMRTPVTCRSVEQKWTCEGGKPGHQPHWQSRGVDHLSSRTEEWQDSQHPSPLQEGTEHYLKTRKASDEQTFITECASAKTKIHDKLLVLAHWQYEQAVLAVILQIIWV